MFFLQWASSTRVSLIFIFYEGIQKWIVKFVTIFFQVNCLKVTGDLIKELDELKNCKILQCLIEKKTLNNLDETCDSHNYINEFLKKQYPLFEISNDLNNCEIVELTSLLIHYFCLKIKDDFIMKAMCKHLSTEDQTDIMQFVNFLMNISSISNQSIKEAIAGN